MSARYKTNANDTRGLPEHPFVIAGHKTFRVKKTNTIPLLRSEQLALIAQAKITKIPAFTGRVIDLSED